MRAYEAEGRKPAVRFRLPDEGETVVEDLVRGTVPFDNATLSDFVILRANGIPTYHFSAVFDDVDMDITHVIRGEDLFPSTPCTCTCPGPGPGQAARLRPPRPDRGGRPAQAVQAPRQGVGAAVPRRRLPAEAMVNYLALLGWSLDDHTELFGLADLERLFCWSGSRATRPPSTPRSSTPSTAITCASWRRPTSPPGPGRSSRWRPPRGRPALLAAAAPLVQERSTT